MRVSLEWLGEYVDIELTPEELAEALTLSGTAVDRVHALGGGVTGVVVAQVLEVKKHPGADSLMLAVVDDGAAVREVVCGAPNLSVGMKSPLATVGATLPAVSPKPLKRARIRGVESDGMLLAADELGIGEDHTGIIELPADSPLGTDVHDLLPLEDVVFDLEITPNRPDCMSMIGVAREVAAVIGGTLRMPPADLREEGLPAVDLAKVVVRDEKGCPRYSARVVSGVEIAPSPLWMQRRLTAAGLRPISNVVDVTNYVLLETGQPLHAFDLDALGGRTIIVRKAMPGETMNTLDGVKRELDVSCVVIADDREPVALAGIMGGEDSEVRDRSRNILIESAHFDPVSILLASKRLGLRTEASGRFERGVDPDGTLFAAARAARLIQETAGGAIAPGVIDVYPVVIEPHTLHLRPDRANRLLGTEIPAEEMARTLRRLGAEVRPGEVLEVKAPSFRRDLEREIDLVEEVARVYGYGRIPSTLPAGGGVDAGRSLLQSRGRDLVECMLGLGLCQVVTYSFMRAGDLDLLELDQADRRRQAVRLLNPLAETGDMLRTMLLPGVLRVASANANRGNRDLALFETGRVFVRSGDGGLPEETETLGLLLHGSPYLPAWSREGHNYDFFDLKGMVESLAGALGVRGIGFEPSEDAFLAPGQTAAVTIAGEHAGYIGRVHPRVAGAFGLEGDIFAGEVSISRLIGSIPEKVYVPVGRFPSVKVDIAVVVDEGVPASAVGEIIRSRGGADLRSARLFDVYRGPQAGEGRKSLAYALEYGSGAGTLTDEMAHAQMEGLIRVLRDELGASIRGRESEGEGT